MVTASATPTAPEHLANKDYVDSKSAAGTDGLVGMIAAFHKTPLPTNWVQCNGQTIASTTYPELVEYLTGSATATSATMPDYSGYFLRGVNMGATGLDAGRTLASIQADGLASHGHTASAAATTATAVDTDTEAAVGLTTSSDGSHTHTYSRPTGDDAYATYTGFGYYSAKLSGTSSGYITAGGAHTHTATVPAHLHSVTVPAHGHTITVNATGGTETRPDNIAVIYAMRAK